MVMEPADVRDLPDRAAGWLLRRPRSRRILVQGEVSAPLVIIIQETPQGPSEGPLIPHDDMVETLAPQGPDQAFHVGILPRGARCNHELLGTTTLQEATEVCQAKRRRCHATTVAGFTHGPPPAAPHSREQHPQESVGPTEPEPPWCSLLEDGQLVAERQDLGLEFNASSEAGPHGGDEGNDAWVHTLHGIRRDR